MHIGLIRYKKKKKMPTHTTICIKVNLNCWVAAAVKDLASVNFLD